MKRKQAAVLFLTAMMALQSSAMYYAAETDDTGNLVFEETEAFSEEPSAEIAADILDDTALYEADDLQESLIEDEAFDLGETEDEALSASAAAQTVRNKAQTKRVFSDVPVSGTYYSKPVYWAVANGITNGYIETNTFDPFGLCTREQMITFLWRTKGKPAPKAGVQVRKFKDVKAGEYYEKAVKWAASYKITTGYGDGTFGVGKTCTREDSMTFLWRAAGKPSPKSGVTISSYSDIAEGEYYYNAVRWGASYGITNGYEDGTFGYGKNVERKDMITFLYRFANLKPETEVPQQETETQAPETETQKPEPVTEETETQKPEPGTEETETQKPEPVTEETETQKPEPVTEETEPVVVNPADRYIYDYDRSIAGGSKMYIGVYQKWTDTTPVEQNITITVDNDCISIEKYVSSTTAFKALIFGRKAGIAHVTIRNGNGQILHVNTVTVTSNDTEYERYQSWKASVKAQIWTSNMTAFERMEAIAKYSVDHYSYNANYASRYGFSNGAGADCWGSTDLLIDFAKDLGLKAEAYHPKSSVYTASHYLAKVWIGSDVYFIEAGTVGAAGSRPYFIDKNIPDF